MPSVPTVRPHRLTQRQELFAREFVKDMNASAAARRCGYAPGNCDVQGSQLLSKPKIQARVAALQAERTQRLEVDSDFVLARLLEEVNADAGELYDDLGRLKPVREWPLVWRRGLVSTIRTTELYDQDGESTGQQKDVVLVDRVRRLELLGKHIRVNAFSDKVTVGLDSPLQELFKQIAGNVVRPALDLEREEWAQIEGQVQRDEGDDPAG